MKFDLHGTVTVRLVDAQERDVQAVGRQLGPIGKADDSSPADITIRFVDRLTSDSPLRYLGLHDGGFTDDAFLILRSKHKARARTQIPMDRIGGACEIVCEHGIPAVPLLLAIVNLTAAAKGVLALHAAAFEWGGQGTVVTGWSKGGKTETLLSFRKEGARYVADEWCYVTQGGKEIFGVPEPIRLWHWQLSQIPEFRRFVPAGSRLKMASLGIPSSVLRVLPPAWQTRSLGRNLQRVSHFLEQHRNTLVAPDLLFGKPVGDTTANFDRLVFIVSAEASSTYAEPVPSEEVAARMSSSLSYERQPLEQYYRMFQFAFPGAGNPILDDIENIERRLLSDAFEGKQALRVEHPYPVDFRALFNCLKPLVC